jgi:tetratricopeptide (TPR) repeat protein
MRYIEADDEDLKMALTDGLTVLLCGAGVSIEPPAALPDWSELRDLTIAAVADRHRPLGKYVEPLCRLPMIAVPGKGLTPEVVASIMRSRCPGFFESLRVLEDGEPNYNHKLVARLAATGLLRFVMTTNFDLFFENAFAAEGVSYRTYRTVDEYVAFDVNDSSILHLFKLHGCLSEPSTITATTEQEYLGLPTEKRMVLRQLMTGRWLATWGYSGADLKIDPDYLEMIGAKGDCRGFFWNLYASAVHVDEPNSYVLKVAEEYGERACFGLNILPAALEHLLPKLPARPTGNLGDASWRTARRERLGSLLQAWASEHVDPRAACVIIGELLDFAGMPQAALEAYAEMSELAVKAGDQVTWRTALGKRADALAELGSFAEAEALYREMESASIAEGDVVSYVWALLRRGQLTQYHGHLDQAADIYATALAHANRAGLLPDRIHLLHDLAKLERDRGNLKQALTWWSEALTAHQQLGDLHGVAEAHRGQAAIHQTWGEFDVTEQALSEARDADLALGDRSGLTQTLVQRAQVNIARNHLTTAETDFEEAAELATQCGDHGLILLVKASQATLADFMSRPDTAWRLGEEVIAAYRQSDAPRMLGKTLFSQAYRCGIAGRKEDKAAYLAEALELFIRVGDHLDAGLASRERAREAAAANQAADAAASYQQSSMFFRLGDYHTEAADTLAEMQALRPLLPEESPWALDIFINNALAKSGVTIAELYTLAGVDARSQSGNSADLIALMPREVNEMRTAIRFLLLSKQQAGEAADYASCLKWSRFGYELATSIGDQYVCGVCLNDCAVALGKLGLAEQAHSAYTLSTALALSLADYQEVVVRSVNHARLMHRLTNDAAALTLARQAATTAEQVPHAKRPKAQVMVAEILEELRQWPEALRLFRAAVATAQDISLLARAFQGCGKAFHELGKYADSARCRARAAELLQQAGQSTYAAVLAFLAAENYLLAQARSDAARLYRMTIELGSDASMTQYVDKSRARLAELEQSA